MIRRGCVLLAFIAALWLVNYPMRASAADPAEIRGFVADVRGGERLERVRIRLLPVAGGQPQQVGLPSGAPAIEAVSGAKGEFAIGQIPPGEYELSVATVGYRVHHQKLTLEPGERIEMEVALSPEAFTQRETIEVTEHVFEPLEPAAVAERTLTHNEVKNLGSVLADDPLRAVQAMPGVSSSDDFEARFALQGAPFEDIGIYLDGVLLHAPFHTLRLTQQTGSLTMLNGDMIDTLALLTGGFSSRYGDRTAGAVAITSREGGRLHPTARITASASNAGALAEGPLGSARRGSWMAAFRKSYLDYIIRRTSSDPSLAFGFLDGESRVVYDVGQHYQASLHFASGQSALDRSHFKSQIGPRAVMTSEGRQTLAILGLRYTAGPRLLINTQLAGIRETYLQWNPQHVPLDTGRYREWTGRAEGTLYWRAGMAVEFGGDARRIYDESVDTDYSANRYFDYQRYKGAAWRESGYVQQTWQRQRWRLGAGLRWDRLRPDDCGPGGNTACRAQARNTYSPRVSLAIPLPFSQSLQLGWGQYRQFPELRALFGTAGNPSLSPARATHYVVAWEWQLRERTRLSAQVYDREDRLGVTQPWFEPRLLTTGKVWGYSYTSPFQNSVVGHSRGLELMLQRRSANRLTGWLSYSYGRTHARDTVTGRRFPYDYDQKHNFNAYASYRLRASLNLSAKWIVGSGFPMPAYLRLVNGAYYLAVDPNRLRLDTYQRLDLRVNKSLLFARRRLTLYGEVINAFNSRNLRYSELSSYNSKTGAANPHFDRMFPIIPSVGMVYEF
jgi:outer membrane cobalamin receptor